MKPAQIYKKAKNIFGLQQVEAEWIEFIKFLKKVKPKKIIEIGTYRGGSAYTFSLFADLLICIDNSTYFKPKKRKLVGENTRLFFINKSSKNPRVINKIKKILTSYDQQVDLLFIDGAHTYRGAKKDFTRYSAFVKPGGYIVLHDIKKSTYHIQLGCLVYQLWEELKTKYPEHQEIILARKWGGIGIIKMPNPKDV